MLWPFIGVLSYWACVLLGFTQALHLHVRGTNELSTFFYRPLESRVAGGLTLNNSVDISYYADIALGNQTFQVLIDTGSSDLWVAGKVAQSKHTGFNASIQYAANSVTGPVKQARLDFAGHTVVDQAYLEIVPTSINKIGHGVLGLGPGSGSFIADKLETDGAVTVLERIFMQDRFKPNIFTILLGRDKDPTDFFTGSITVGEVLEDYIDILKELKLNITKVPDTQSDDQHLQFLLDEDGLIGPDGNSIPLTTDVEQTENKKQATVVLDCGFTLPQLPRTAVDSIYSRFHGAEFIQVSGLGGVWILPCVQEVNITLKFAGKEFPIHPLDMTVQPSAIKLTDLQTSDGEEACIGTFQPFTYDRGKAPSYDMVLGMAFMRNVYSLFDYGDFIRNSTDLINPYVQMLSITDRAEAHQDFVTVRLGGNDTTATRGLKKAPSNPNGKSSVYYIVAIVAGVALLLAGAVFFVFRRRFRCRR